MNFPKSSAAFIILVATALFAFLNPTVAKSQSSLWPQDTIVIGIDSDMSTYLGKWEYLIYAEAFRRLNIKFELPVFPLKRLEVLANTGIVDGEAARISEYGEAHPDLIRVKEPLVYLNFSIYSANPKLNVKTLADIPHKNLTIEHLRNNMFCALTITKLFPHEKLIELTTSEQGIRKLLANRIDLYCDIDLRALSALHSLDLKASEIQRFYKVLDIKSEVPLYPFLQKKHAALAVKLARTIKRMRAEGLIEKYRLNVERELGWSH